MAENTLGRYVTIWKGTYNPLTAYERLDTVYHESAIYICTEPCTGIPPTNTEYWEETLRSATRVDMEAAQDAAQAAENSKIAADGSAQEADTSKVAAAGSAQAAAGSASAAANSAADANTAKLGAEAARDAAAQSAQGAEQAKLDAQAAANSVDGPGLLAAIETKVDKAGGTMTGPLETPSVVEGGIVLVDKYASKQHGHGQFFHNYDFRNPVNQRGVSGAITTVGEHLDRWRLVNGTVTVNADNIVLAAGATTEQRIEKYMLSAGEIVCISAQLADLTIKSVVGTMPLSVGTTVVLMDGFGTVTLGNHTDYMYVQFTPTAEVTLLRVYGEPGAVSTLAYAPPMDLASENLKCYRYLHVFNQGGASSAKIGDMPRAWGTDKVMLTYSPPVPMLELPIITIVGQFVCLGDNGNIDATVSAFAHNANTSTPEHFLLDSQVAGGSLTSGRHYIVRATSSAARIIFSCEL